MTLQDSLSRLGQYLFRYRSFLPLAMLVATMLAFWPGVPRADGEGAYAWRSAAIALTIAGIVVRCVTIGRVPRGTSGRNTTGQKASRLNTTGLYSVVRNPLYVGNAMVWIGITLLLQDLLLTLVFAVAIWVYYVLVVFAEEEFLTRQFGQEYLEYAARTPALMPRLDAWVSPDRAFSWRMVLRREHDSVFSAVTGVVLVFHLVDAQANGGRFLLRREWAIPWLVVAVLWAVIKVLKKRTDLLRVPRV